MPPIDVARARRETPGCENVVHLNNAGASLAPAPVLDATVEFLRLEASIGGYEAADRERDRLERPYDALASLLNCVRDEVALVESATRAWDMAFYSLHFKPGDRILTGLAEYGSNYIAFLHAQQRWGVQVDVVPNDPSGALSVGALREMLDERVKLIAVTHVPTNGGLVNPAAEIGKVARAAGVLYLLDVCQSAGQMPLDVQQLDCDMCSGTGRKFLRAPRGTGFLYVRRSRLAELDPPFLEMHSAQWVARDRYEVRADARRFEGGETSYAARIGLGVAVDYALGWGLEPIWDRVRLLADRLRGGITALPGAAIHDLGDVRCGIVTFTLDGFSPAEIRSRLRERGINVWVSQPGGARLDMEARGLEMLGRASVHYYNTEAEVDRCVEALAALRG